MIDAGSPWVVIGFPWISINIALIVSFSKLDSAQDTLLYESVKGRAKAGMA